MGPDGIAVVRVDMTDIGTGTYTIVTQVAAEALGLPIDRVRVELGRSDFPRGAGSGGSFGATNYDAPRSTTRVPRAAREARRGGDHVPRGGRSRRKARSSRHGHDPNYKAYSIHAYGAHFAEVGVDADTGEIRLRRMLGVFAAGRIFNAKTARSQLIGGMTFGVSSALHEEASSTRAPAPSSTAISPRYLVPVHADIPAIDAVLLDGFDDKANVLGAKGVGELGNCGANAAVANAVFNATGVRVRDFPITIEKVLPGLPLLEA